MRGKGPVMDVSEAKEQLDAWRDEVGEGRPVRVFDMSRGLGMTIHLAEAGDHADMMCDIGHPARIFAEAMVSQEGLDDWDGWQWGDRLTEGEALEALTEGRWALATCENVKRAFMSEMRNDLAPYVERMAVPTSIGMLVARNVYGNDDPGYGAITVDLLRPDGGSGLVSWTEVMERPLDHDTHEWRPPVLHTLAFDGNAEDAAQETECEPYGDEMAYVGGNDGLDLMDADGLTVREKWNAMVLAKRALACEDEALVSPITVAVEHMATEGFVLYGMGLDEACGHEGSGYRGVVMSRGDEVALVVVADDMSEAPTAAEARHMAELARGRMDWRHDYDMDVRVDVLQMDETGDVPVVAGHVEALAEVAAVRTGTGEGSARLGMDFGAPAEEGQPVVEGHDVDGGPGAHEDGDAR